MDRDGPYWRWARKVVARGSGVGGVLKAGAVLRVLGTPEELEARLKELEGASTAAQAFETPGPFELEGLGAAEPLAALQERLERAKGQVQAATAWLEENPFDYKPDRDELVWTGPARGPGRRVVTIAACQVWWRYYGQAEDGHDIYRGTDLDPSDVADRDDTVLARVRGALEPRFPPHLLPMDRLENAIRNHRGAAKDPDVPDLRGLPRRI